MKFSPPEKKSSAMSLVEVLAVVAILGSVAAFALPRLGGIKTGADEVKLYTDVAILNSAVKVYLSSGGSLASDSTVDDVIEKIGRSVSADKEDTFVGFTGSMVDNRLKAEWISPKDVNSGKPRAVWNAAGKRFEVVSTSVSGVASFSVNDDDEDSGVDEETGDEPAKKEEKADRVSSMKYASKTDWVWDYTESAAPLSAGPTVIPVTSVPGNSAPPVITPPVTPPSGPSKLLPPVFSMAPGPYSLSDFSMSVTLSNPNDAAKGSVYIRLPGQSWSEYAEGTTFTVLPGDNVQAFTMSSDVARYDPSDVVGGDYTATPIQLALQILSTSTTVNYWDIVDADARIDLRVPNVWRVPSFLRQRGLFSTYFTSNGSDPTSSAQASLLSTYDDTYSRDSVLLDPAMWSGGNSLQLKAFAKSSIENYVRSSTVITTTVNAEPLQLSPPLISMEARDAGAQMVSLGLDGRYPPGTQIYYNTSGDPPYYDADAGRVVNGTPYVGSFLLQPKLDGENSGGTTGNVDIGIGRNDVKISQVVLKSKNRDIVQNQSYYFDTLDNPGFDGYRDNEVVDSSNDSIELSSITIRQGNKTIVADQVNVLQVSVSNLNYPDNALDWDVTVKRDGKVVADLSDITSRSDNNGKGKGKGPSGDNKFSFEVAKTLSSTNLRDYVDYSGGNTARMIQSDYDFDVAFSPLTNNDFLVVMERFGNSTFDLRPLDAAGQVIAGSQRLTFREYSWNTGHAPSDMGGQAMFFSVIDIEKFGVDTNLNSIAGFRVNNDGGADFKFLTISDDSFEDREVRYTGRVQAVAFPPEGMEIWFEPSVVASREVEGTTTVSGAP